MSANFSKRSRYFIFSGERSTVLVAAYLSGPSYKRSSIASYGYFIAFKFFFLCGQSLFYVHFRFVLTYFRIGSN